MERRVFTSKEVQRLAGISYRQLDYWCSSGLIRPEEREGKGKGDFRLFTFRDIIGLKLIKRMKDAGVSLQALRKVQEAVQSLTESEAEDVFKDTFLIVQGSEVYMVNGKEVIATLRKPGAQAIPAAIMDMAGTIQELKAEVATLKKPA